MSLETGTKIKDLISSNPPGGDPASQGDDHIRLIKAVLKSQFSGFTEGISITKKESEINALMSLGAFGLGGTVIPLSEPQFAADDLACGFYYVSGDAVTGFLPQVNDSGFAIVLDHSTAGHNCKFFVSAVTRFVYSRTKLFGAQQNWRKHWDAIEHPAMASVYDTSAAAFVNPTAFGLLGVPIPTGGTANLNAAPYIGVAYSARWVGGSWVNQPPEENGASGAIVETVSYSTLYAQQRFICVGSQREWVRWMFNGTINAWYEVPQITTSRANPGYQISGGIVRQWGTTGNIADDGSLVVTFPRAMTTCYSVVATPIAAFSGTSFSCAGVSAISGTGFTLTHMSNQAAAVAFNWMAEGSVT